MDIKKLDLRDKILYILGMSLCGVIVFVVVAGVIVALFVPASETKRRKKKSATDPVIDDEKDVQTSSKANQTFTDILQKIKQSFRHFTLCYMTSVKEGADLAKYDIIEAVEERDPSTDSVTEKFLKAVQKGVQHAGVEMIVFVIDMFEKMKKSSDK
ncbi:hypothetical protein [Gracilibacillus massiliensis]|uniref:hypothetical protein n=1 Tax=Gracilibacillus massiliensis TaxID=1564956 RepID=UPI00071C7BCF|nr:hypothetical protein [Gracilibacillus massiliensis]